MTEVPTMTQQASQRAKPMQLRDLFAGPIRYEIPSYQRAYSWEEKHLKILMEDLREHPPGTAYYFGHFLFEQGSEPDLLWLIDGQQRLTSLLLLVASLTRHLKDAVTVSRLQSQYLQDRLCTVAKDQDAFADLLRSGQTGNRHGSHSKQRLIAACTLFDAVLAKTDETELLRWLAVIETSEVTTFTVEGKAQAAQIFTLQNSRGKDLTKLEELKAFMMFGVYLNAHGRACDKFIGTIERSFERIYGHIEELTLIYAPCGAKEDAVLTHHNNAYARHSGTAMESLRQEVGALPERFAKAQNLADYAQALADTFEHVVALERLMALDELLADPIILDGHNAWPLLIKLYRHLGASIRTADWCRELLQNVEITLFKLEFQHGSSSNYLIDEAKKFNGSDASIAALTQKLRSCVHHGFRGRQDFDANVHNHLEGNYHNDRTYRYALWKYENNLRLATDRKLSPADYLSVEDRRMAPTIEHIAPQNGTEDPEFIRKCLHNLGNLVLMPHAMNASQSDNAPEVKAERLDTTFASQREVKRIIEAEGWGQTQIMARKEVLLKFIRTRWRLNQETTLQ